METQGMRRVKLERGLPEVWEGVTVAGLREGTLTLTNDSLLFMSKNGQAVGCDLDTIRSISIPERRTLAVAFSAAGEVKTLQFDFNCEIPVHQDNDLIYELRSEAERFCQRLHTLVPDVPVAGYRTMEDEAWRKMMKEARETLATKYDGANGDWDAFNTVQEPVLMTNCHSFVFTLPQAIDLYGYDADRYRKDLELIAVEGEAAFGRTKESAEKGVKNCESSIAPVIARYGKLRV